MRNILLQAVVAISIFLPFLSSAQGVQQAPAISPSFPKEMNFANQIFNFDRFDMYERMDREIISITYSHTNTLLTLKRANKYLPEIIPILNEEKIPTDFIYLAAIESGFSEQAVSIAKAAGIWQFMPQTAKQYGLEVNEYVDERYNLEKATRAACKYFRKAYQKYNDWISVAASYNAGMARISNSLKEQKEEQAINLHLNQETTRYMYRLLAMKLVMSNPQKYGFNIKDSQLYQHIGYKEVKVDGPVENWPEWAQAHGISYLILKQMNPWIRGLELPNKLKKTYKIRIPLREEINVSTQTKQRYIYNWTQN